MMSYVINVIMNGTGNDFLDYLVFFACLAILFIVFMIIDKILCIIIDAIVRKKHRRNRRR